MHSLGLVHFDLKLENFMVEGVLNLENVYAWVKVIDFGWSESLEKS
jgi:serine/threonine protein kinase